MSTIDNQARYTMFTELASLLALSQLLIDKGIITEDELAKYTESFSSNPKIKENIVTYEVLSSIDNLTDDNKELTEEVEKKFRDYYAEYFPDKDVEEEVKKLKENLKLNKFIGAKDGEINFAELFGMNNQ